MNKVGKPLLFSLSNARLEIVITSSYLNPRTPETSQCNAPAAPILRPRPRKIDRQVCWSLEVVDHNGTSTVWSETFATDRHAHAALIETLETEGIRSFSDENSGWLH